MKIAICGKEPLFLDALASLLNYEGHFDVVARSTSSRECLTSAKELHANLVVVDTQGLEQNEIEFFMGARTFGDFGIAMITDSKDFDRIQSQEPDGLISRDGATEDLFAILKDLSTKFTSVGPSKVKDGRSRGYNSELNLTRREFEVSALVAKGFSNRRISAVTGLQEQSVKNLVSVIMGKMACENRTQLALRIINSKSYQSLEPIHG